ncbi:MAG: sigma-70 family RNA polymerase sigma factor [Chloroflexi bacterium]|nr:sigma-70 family RNA polymerase sigma factor [Chloroflexota bacterium]
MPEDAPEEAELIAAAARGNTGAFAELVRIHRMRVVRTAFGVLGSQDEAEDVAQDVFIKVWHALDTFQHDTSFASWVYRITVNTAIDVLRHRKEEVGLDVEYASPLTRPEDAALRRDNQQRVRTAIASLPESARVALTLREFEQLSYKEISEILQIPIGTVMSRLNYARASLKKILSGEGAEE